MNTMKEKQVALSSSARTDDCKIERTLNTAQQNKDQKKPTTTMLATTNNDSITESHH